MAESLETPEFEQDSPQAEELFGLSRELVRQILDALDAHSDELVRELVLPLHPADAADLIERVDPDHRRMLLAIIGDDLDSEILPELDEEIRDDVIDILGLTSVAAAMEELDSDDAVELASQLEEDERQAVYEALPSEDRAIIEQGLSYPEDSAGRLMQRELVTVPDFWTVGETIDFMRTGVELPDDFFNLFVVDPKHQPVGTVRLSRLVRVQRPTLIRDIIDEDLHSIPVSMDQEEVAYLFRQQDLIAAPVVDDSGRLVGRITVDDVLDVIDEEAEDDMLALAGVKDDDFYSAVFDTTRSRFGWLMLNLFTAIVASVVIGMFQETIERVVALAVLMPIVASMGGNAGTQTLTVAVRALAMKELTGTNALRVVGKEFMVAFLNGMVFALIAGAVAWFWFGQEDIGLIIAAAMVINLICAGLAGILIPLGLERVNVDPAVASTVFLTTITDVVGFLAFLGLAALFLF